MNDQAWQATTPLVPGGPEWLTLTFVVIGLGVVAALVILIWGARLARRRARAERELEHRGEVHRVGDPPRMIPPAAPVPTSAAMPEEEPLPPEPPLADEPIAAAASFDASPASLAASEPSEPVADTGGDDLTRMKGVGPKLAQRLNAVGVTRFAQLAALTPADAEALDAQLGDFRGRIHRDRWIEQAGFLARGDVPGYEAQFGKL
ncbi:MAG: hypothetical protein J7500_17630 [Sphingomonas sp.]|uniref:hypothetical protein n=1 Tax=Sphingomonas sp. TaxID=28214 RepID=UPI001B09CC1C|nr:hypothetical protein [Sphingomonas sp.]MBO9624533.1 hypothetical protein [Sphingomonas sp.]